MRHIKIMAAAGIAALFFAACAGPGSGAGENEAKAQNRTTASAKDLTLLSIGTAAAVSQPQRESGFLGTAWTLVMDLSDPAVTYYSRRHFDKPLRFEFERKGAE